MVSVQFRMLRFRRLIIEADASSDLESMAHDAMVKRWREEKEVFPCQGIVMSLPHWTSAVSHADQSRQAQRLGGQCRRSALP